MIFDLKELIHSISTALNVVEEQYMGVSANHGKRVGVLCALMGQQLGWNENDTLSLTVSGILHDNALTEYLLAERTEVDVVNNTRLHCEYGQRNLETLPLPSPCNVSGYVLYHHEVADGSGPFGKTAEDIPLGAQLISAANYLDEHYHLQRLKPGDAQMLIAHIADNVGTIYTKPAAEALLSIMNEDLLVLLRDENMKDTRTRLLPPWNIDIEDEGLLRLAAFVARIIDYKSRFTRKHTVDIAERTWIMSAYYGYNRELSSKLYLAAALHDIGKMYIPSEILEKPGKLNPEEFEVIASHVRYTYELLEDVQGLEDICQWASNHHEKLDGSGYPFGKTAEELDFLSRLMACIDIYQAVSEERPYHPRRSHADTMAILLRMANEGKVDAQIAADLDTAMKPYEGLSLPSPFEPAAKCETT